MKYALVFLAIVSTSAIADDVVKVQPPQQKMLSTPSGRFVFGQISDMRADQFMLDTQTGRLWQVIVWNDADGKASKQLTAVPYSDIKGNNLTFVPK